MDQSERYLGLLRRKVEQIKSRSLGMESMPVTEAVAASEPAAADAVLAGAEAAAFEAVVRWYRPVLAITDDRFVRSEGNPVGDPRFVDPNASASQALLSSLEASRSRLDPAIRSVGRIELTNNIQFPWVGTGWIIDSELGDDIIVTNAHVAREFAMRAGAGFKFRPGVPDFSFPQSVNIDFREEVGAAAPREFPITEVIWISDAPGFDIAILRVARTAGSERVDPPIKLLNEEMGDDRMLAVIGFPGSNNGYDLEPFRKLFGPVLGKKRFSPGFYSGRRAGSVTYDCSTLPGSSGSIVLDVTTGRAAGLHFAGTAFDTNYAVPSADLARLIRERPWQGEAARKPRPMLGDAPQPDASGTARSLAPAGSVGGGTHGITLRADGTIEVALPLEITVKLGLPKQAQTTGIRASPSSSPVAPRTDSVAAEAAAEQVREHVGGERAVLSVKTDYLFRDGLITDDYGVIVSVAPGASVDPAAYNLGSHVSGVKISVGTADPQTIATEQFGIVPEAFGGRRAGYERDLADHRFDLSPVTDQMRITLHVSPEAGWPVLRKFLEQDDCEQLTIGMYHMTAPHVVCALKTIAKRGRSRITLTLDRQRGDDAENPDDIRGETKEKDIPERDTIAALKRLAKDSGARFDWAAASLGANGLFASAYHIKVAVSSKLPQGGQIEEKAFWLSSGNWQSSNQAPIEKPVEQIAAVTWEEVADYNREWHALVEHRGLASIFRNHLEQDYKDNADAAESEAPTPRVPDVLVPQAFLERPQRPSGFRTFEPEVIDGEVTVQPLLTPDNYPEVIANLISRATERVLIENQSFSFWSDISSTPEHFLKIARAVKGRQEAGLDVRIIFRSGYGKERETLRQLKKFGINADSEHVRYFDKCHTKGIVIDRDIAVLGSQNWTAAGTGPNRDASLVIWHPSANAYFARIFDYDWREVARNRVGTEERVHESLRFIAPGVEAAVPTGYQRISLAEFLGET